VRLSGFKWLRIGTSDRVCEHGMGAFGFHSRWGFIYQLSDYQRFKKDRYVDLAVDVSV
jgi:hypothetical protein